MKKEEVIKEAWGELWDLFTPKEKIYILQNNGFYNGYRDAIWDTYNISDDESDEFDFIPGKGLIPCSIENIENNNGWIKIESEEDLPKVRCELLVYPEFERQYVFFFVNDEQSKETLIRNHTHYQLIEKPKPPIY